MALNPFRRLYLHVPFCQTKCDYCAFYSEAAPAPGLVEQWLKRLAQDFEPYTNHPPLVSLFIGGGTPSYLSATQLTRLFNLIFNTFTFTPDAEINIECNPESMTADKIAAVAPWVNRVSMGVQTIDATLRQTLGRRGSWEQATQVLTGLHAAGIKRLGLDLIYGIPGQTPTSWERTLNTVLEWPIGHLSTYSLSIDPGSLLQQRGINVTDQMEADSLTMIDITQALLQTHGWHRYEISNYAADETQPCQHNLDIWYGDTYLGCGPAASSFNGEDRFTQPSSLIDWLNHVPPIVDHILPEQRAKEILLMGLRTCAGWTRQHFIHRTGFDWMKWQNEWQPLCDWDL